MGFVPLYSNFIHQPIANRFPLYFVTFFLSFPFFCFPFTRPTYLTLLQKTVLDCPPSLCATTITHDPQTGAEIVIDLATLAILDRETSSTGRTTTTNNRGRVKTRPAYSQEIEKPPLQLQDNTYG